MKSQELKKELIKVVDTDLNKWEYLKIFVPDFDYCQISTVYTNPMNIVGHQQRAFVIYWAIEEHQRTEGIGLEPGCGQAISPFCIGTDFYAGNNHPQYGGGYYPHIRCLGELLPFRDNTFDFIVSHHSLEHMLDTEATLKEWLRVVKHGSKIAIVMPDKKYGPFGDHGHVGEHTSEEFRNILNRIPNIVVIEHDTFKNKFSYNTVIQKI